MALITGTNLQNAADVINEFMVEILSQVNAPPQGSGPTLSFDRNTINIGADSGEIWITIPFDRMSHGRAYPIGLQQSPDSTNEIDMNISDQTFTNASDSDVNAFRVMNGQPMILGSATSGGIVTTAPRVNGFDRGANYLNHWIFTNPNFGALTSFYDTGEETYAYMVVEQAVGEYRVFGFCEAIQLGAWPTTASGLYLFGCYIHRSDSFGGGSTSVNGNAFVGTPFNSKSSTANTPTPNGGVRQLAHTMYQPDRDVTTFQPWLRGVEGGNLTFQDWLGGNDPRDVNEDHNNNPSVFSGIALRTPIYGFATRKTVSNISLQDASVPLQMISELPDIFYCNIRDLDPGTIFVEGADRFLILPIYEKGGTSGNKGVLIRNPNL